MKKFKTIRKPRSAINETLDTEGDTSRMTESTDPERDGSFLSANFNQSLLSDNSPANYIRATRRVIVVSVCISEKVSGHQEAYENLIQALINIQMSNSGLLFGSDYICYNIGAPLASNYLRSDL